MFTACFGGEVLVEKCHRVLQRMHAGLSEVPEKCERLGVRAKKVLPVAVSYNLAVAGVVGDSDTQSALLMSSLLHM